MIGHLRQCLTVDFSEVLRSESLTMETNAIVV